MEESPAACQLIFWIDRATLGRRRLAVRTGLSEMTVRLELERLRDLGLLSLRRSGAELTKAGRARFRWLFDRVKAVSEPDLTSLRLDEVAVAALVTTEEKSPAWRQRDLAIREGATGLLLLRLRPEGWCFAENDEPVAVHNQEDAAVLKAAFPVSCVEDRLIIAFGPDRRCAGLGLWRVVGKMAGDT